MLIPVFVLTFSRQLCSGFVFGPLAGVVAHWFKRRKGLALGAVAVGSSAGGALFPIAVHNLINKVGYVESRTLWPQYMR